MGGVQSVHVDSVHEDYIQRAATGGLFGDTLVIVLERDHSPKSDEKERIKRLKKKCWYSCQFGGRHFKKRQSVCFVSVSLYMCHDWVQYTSPFKVKLQDWIVTASSGGMESQWNVPGSCDGIWKVTAYVGCCVMSWYPSRTPHCSFSPTQTHPKRNSVQNRGKKHIFLIRLCNPSQNSQKTLFTLWMDCTVIEGLVNKNVIYHLNTVLSRTTEWPLTILAISTFSPVGSLCSNSWRMRVCACACGTGIVRNELICWYAKVVHISSSFRPHTHTHILIPFEDREPMGLKVDIATHTRILKPFEDSEPTRLNN